MELGLKKIIFADTTECDEEGRGTPVFGTQKVRIRGNVVVEIDVVVQTSNTRRRTVTLTANIPITPTELTNFFELCIPSVFNSAFFPRFAEFCNVLCETRLATNNIMRDIRINPETGEVRVDLIIAICISCEKKNNSTSSALCIIYWIPTIITRSIPQFVPPSQVYFLNK